MVIAPLSEVQAGEIAEKGIYWVPTLELWRGVHNLYGVQYDTIAVNNLRIFHRMGGKVALGTDFNGFICPFDRDFPITEVKLMREAGMSMMDIIVAGTKNASIVYGMDESLGTLEPGKIADIVVIDGDPLMNIELFLKPFMVLKEGKLVF